MSIVGDQINTAGYAVFGLGNMLFSIIYYFMSISLLHNKTFYHRHLETELTVNLSFLLTNVYL